jgi:hypothetical protein
VKKAQLYLNRRYSTSITRWKIADAINVSEDYLTRVFKKELGISPGVPDPLRIHVARRMLREGAESVGPWPRPRDSRTRLLLPGVPQDRGCTPSSFRTDGEPVRTNSDILGVIWESRKPV